MSGLLFIIIVVAALATFAALAQSIGVDSRLESRDPRSPVPGISA